MKRFLLFAGPTYYAAGGWYEFQGDFDTLAEAKLAASRLGLDFRPTRDWWHVVDTETKEVVTE